MHSTAIEHQPMKNAKLAKRKHWELANENDVYLGKRTTSTKHTKRNTNKHPIAYGESN
jgi:hypothetical protein